MRKIPGFFENFDLENDCKNIRDFKTIAEQEKTLIFYMEYGSYDGGSVDILIFNKQNGKCRLIAEGCNGYSLDWDFEIDTSMLNELEKAVRPAGKWLRNYETQEEIYDGFGWTLEYHRNSYNINSCGYMANPVNFQRVGNNILKEIKKIRRKYLGKGCEEMLPINGYKNASFFVS